jgi:hypothetical protein
MLRYFYLDSFLELSEIAHSITESLQLVFLRRAHVVHPAHLFHQLVDIVSKQK